MEPYLSLAGRAPSSFYLNRSPQQSVLTGHDKCPIEQWNYFLFFLPPFFCASFYYFRLLATSSASFRETSAKWQAGLCAAFPDMHKSVANLVVEEWEQRFYLCPTFSGRSMLMILATKVLDFRPWGAKSTACIGSFVFCQARCGSTHKHWLQYHIFWINTIPNTFFWHLVTPKPSLTSSWLLRKKNCSMTFSVNFPL